MPTYKFEKITQREQRKFTCIMCGKPGSRSQTFMNTLNPFNKNEDGEIRTREEIVEKLRKEGAAWDPTPVHDKCVVSDV